MKVSAILMAAGFSRRMEGRDKLLLPFRGGTLLSRAAELLQQCPLYERILVTTPERAQILRLSRDFRVAINRNPQRGQSESLRLGVQAATGDCYLFCTADQPLLDAAVLQWLLSRAESEKIVYPQVGGSPRSPAVFGGSFREELLALRGDAGGAAVRRRHPEACLALPAEAALPFWDIDTWEDYQELLRSDGGNDSGVL